MLKPRSPIVTVLGHVDHGKTTLLDAIRKSDVAAHEAGGITQKIGASRIQTPDGEITFIDTPGHAAFSQMRSRGAKVADIALLVVAADDGIKPQTSEALEFIRSAAIPFIVVLTKTDLPSADQERAISMLEQEAVLFEGRGGNTPKVSVSAKKGEGINELLETITLVSQMQDILADEDAPLDAVVIETNTDRRGPVVSVVVRNGSLKVGEDITSEGIETRVRGLYNDKNVQVKSVAPGEPALILGFSELPPVGAMVTRKGEGSLMEKQGRAIKTRIKVNEGQIPVVVKAQSAGALEALLGILPKDIVVIHSSVGDVAESDVFLAKPSGAKIVTFEAKVPSSVKKLADTEAVTIHSFAVIYELIKFLEDLLTSGREEILGRATVLEVFPYEKKKVAGCKVFEGRILKGDMIAVMRGEKELGRARINSLRRGKQILPEAKAGEECGILFEPQLDFEVNDVILSVAK